MNANKKCGFHRSIKKNEIHKHEGVDGDINPRTGILVHPREENVFNATLTSNSQCLMPTMSRKYNKTACGGTLPGPPAYPTHPTVEALCPGLDDVSVQAV